MVSVNEPLRPKLQEPVGDKIGLVFGATGATGRYVVKSLLERKVWKKVVAVGRRPFNPTDYGFSLTDAQTNKLENVVLENITTDVDIAKEKFVGVDTVFNCIGTTRKDAGGAQEFIDIEFGITDKVSQVAKDCGVPHFTVLSAVYADSKNTLGKKEDTVIQKGFLYTSIFRPGLLNRLTSDRWDENLANEVLPSLRVDMLAKAIVLDAENVPKSKKDSSQTPEKPLFYNGSSIIIQQLAFM